MFDDFLEALADNHFEETPVDAKTFVESPDYLGQPGLSDIQYDIVEAMSQIYRKEDLQQGQWKRFYFYCCLCLHCV